MGTSVSRLSAKREAFIASVLEGHSLADSYRAAYRVREGTMAKSIHESASRLAADPRVASRINQLQERLEERRLDSVASQREQVIQRLWDEALNPRNPASSRIRALELLGRTASLRLFDDQAASHPQQTSAEIEVELTSRLLVILQETSGDKAN